jgi:hypothetical protein
MSPLPTPTQVGHNEIAHRVVLAPLACMRSAPGAIPGDLMVEYHRQRTSKGGFTIAETSPVSHARAPGIYTDEQIAGQKLTGTVRGEGTRFLIKMVEAMLPVWSDDRTTVHLSLNGQFGSIFDSDPIASFSHAADALNRFGPAERRRRRRPRDLRPSLPSQPRPTRPAQARPSAQPLSERIDHESPREARSIPPELRGRRPAVQCTC